MCPIFTRSQLNFRVIKTFQNVSAHVVCILKSNSGQPAAISPANTDATVANVKEINKFRRIDRTVKTDSAAVTEFSAVTKTRR